MVAPVTIPDQYAKALAKLAVDFAVNHNLDDCECLIDLLAKTFRLGQEVSIVVVPTDPPVIFPVPETVS